MKCNQPQWRDDYDNDVHDGPATRTPGDDGPIGTHVAAATPPDQNRKRQMGHRGPVDAAASADAPGLRRGCSCAGIVSRRNCEFSAFRRKHRRGLPRSTRLFGHYESAKGAVEAERERERGTKKLRQTIRTWVTEVLNTKVGQPGSLGEAARALKGAGREHRSGSPLGQLRGSQGHHTAL